MTNAQETLETGRALLDPVLAGHGFRWSPGTVGPSSGGQFACGEYIRGNRRLEIHFRNSLGLVTYHGAGESIGHSAYMRAVLGPSGINQYPGFSEDPVDSFRHLAHDLGQFCSAFLTGSDSEFRTVARKAAAEERRSRVRRLP